MSPITITHRHISFFGDPSNSQNIIHTSLDYLSGGISQDKDYPGIPADFTESTHAGLFTLVLF